MVMIELKIIHFDQEAANRAVQPCISTLEKPFPQYESAPDFPVRSSSWAASIVKIGQLQTFVSVIIPFSQGQDVADLLEQLATNLTADGRANVETPTPLASGFFYSPNLERHRF